MDSARFAVTCIISVLIFVNSEGSSKFESSKFSSLNTTYKEINVSSFEPNSTIRVYIGNISNASNDSTNISSGEESTEVFDSIESETDVQSNSNKRDNNGFIKLMIPSYPGLENGHIEETFTYQVRRQTPRIPIAQQIGDKEKVALDMVGSMNGQSVSGNELKADAHPKAYTLFTSKFEKKLEDLENRLGNITNQVALLISNLSDLRTNVITSLTTTNATFATMDKKITRINDSQASFENSTKKLQTDFATYKFNVQGQVQTITAHLRQLQNISGQSFKNVSIQWSNLADSFQNLTSEMKMSELRSRFLQKELINVNTNVQQNTEKVAEILTSEGPLWAEQTTGCGGILLANSGILAYKFRQPYINNERCVWTIRVNRKPRVAIKLLEDGFQNSSNSDFLTITEFTDEKPPVLITSTRLEHGNRITHNFRGPLIFISFFSDSSVVGKGFMLKFEGSGKKVPNSVASLDNPRYTHRHLTSLVGHLVYPEEKDAQYQPFEIATFVINPKGASVQVQMRYTDMEKEESCEYDSLRFYGSVKASYVPTRRYCEQQRKYEAETVNSNGGPLIVVFRSDGSTQFKGFQFSWESI